MQSSWKCHRFCLLLSLCCEAAGLRLNSPQLCRRQLVGVGSAAATGWIGFRSSAAATANAGATETRDGPSRLESEILGRVPAFVIANGLGEPYLTEVDAQGKRSGTVYLGLRDAAAMLDEVRSFDKNATLAIVPLSSVYSAVSKSASEATAARAVLPQPIGSTSLDMRLFRLQPLSDERSEAAALVPGSSNVPLFYEPSLFLTVEGGGVLRVSNLHLPCACSGLSPCI